MATPVSVFGRLRHPCPIHRSCFWRDVSRHRRVILLPRNSGGFANFDLVAEFFDAIRRGDPAAMIVAAAEEVGVDLIVMATHSGREMTRLIFGSVAERVIREAKRSVLNIRPQASAPRQQPLNVSTAIC